MINLAPFLPLGTPCETQNGRSHICSESAFQSTYNETKWSETHHVGKKCITTKCKTSVFSWTSLFLPDSRQVIFRFGLCQWRRGVFMCFMSKNSKVTQCSYQLVELTRRESPAWTQEACRPPRSKYLPCCSDSGGEGRHPTLSCPHPVPMGCTLYWFGQDTPH